VHGYPQSFISRLREKGLPFFKPLKKSGKFEWIAEADEALPEALGVPVHLSNTHSTREA